MPFGARFSAQVGQIGVHVLSNTTTEGFLGRLPDAAYKFMLLFATFVWGISFVFMKTSLDVLPPGLLVGTRFVIASALMYACFFRSIHANLSRKTAVVGALLGVLYFAGYWTQTIGLDHTTPGKNAFLTAAYVVMVPFLFWLLARKRPTIFNVIAAVVCLAGIGFVSLEEDLTIGFGDGMTLLCALFFGLHMASIALFAREHDVFTITFVQFVTVAVLSIAAGLLFEPLPVLAEVLAPDVMVTVLFLAVVASFLASLAQNVGQSRVNASQAALIMSLESVIGVAASVLLYGEHVTLKMLFGFLLIFVAILISELLANREFSWRKKTT